MNIPFPHPTPPPSTICLLSKPLFLIQPSPRQVNHGSFDLIFALTRSMLQLSHGEHAAKGRRSSRLRVPSRTGEGLEVLVHHPFSLPLHPPHRSRVCELLFLAGSEAISIDLDPNTFRCTRRPRSERHFRQLYVTWRASNLFG